MSPMPRSARNLSLPAHTRVRDGYYSWKNPLTGKEHGLGRDRAKALQEARVANNHIAAERGQTSLIDRIKDEKTLEMWLVQYQVILDKRGRKKNSAKQDKSRLKAIRAGIDCSKAIRRITTLDIAGLLKRWIDKDQMRMAESVRSILLDIFNEAIAAGWLPLGANPVIVTKVGEVKIKRARLTLETFLAIYNKAGELDEEPWVQRSMELALVTSQRRQTVGEAQFKQPADKDIGEDGAMWLDGDWLAIHQGKGGNRLRIPLSLRLDVVGWSVGEIIKKCRDHTVSKHMLHHSHTFTRRGKVSNKVFIDTITKAFARCRDATGLTWGDKEPPTYHEIRSLAERLYEKQGNVNTQELLGHKDPRMTRVYHDPRGAEYIDVSVREVETKWRESGENSKA